MTEARSPVRPINWRWIVGLCSAGALFDACQTALFVHGLGKQHTWLVFRTELASWLPALPRLSA